VSPPPRGDGEAGRDGGQPAGGSPEDNGPQSSRPPATMLPVPAAQEESGLGASLLLDKAEESMAPISWWWPNLGLLPLRLMVATGMAVLLAFIFYPLILTKPDRHPAGGGDAARTPLDAVSQEGRSAKVDRGIADADFFVHTLTHAEFAILKTLDGVLASTRERNLGLFDSCLSNPTRFGLEALTGVLTENDSQNLVIRKIAIKAHASPGLVDKAMGRNLAKALDEQEGFARKINRMSLPLTPESKNTLREARERFVAFQSMISDMIDCLESRNTKTNN
jgi:hypothetical protein